MKKCSNWPCNCMGRVPAAKLKLYDDEISGSRRKDWFKLNHFACIFCQILYFKEKYIGV